MMNKKQIATMATCIAMVGVVAVGGTLALLTTEKKTLTNTFTVGEGFVDPGEGDYTFKLDEAVAKQNDEGNYQAVNDSDEFVENFVGAKRTTETQTYGNVQENSYIEKDPTFYVKAQNAPECWVVAYVENETELTIDKSTLGADWTAVKEKGDQWVVDRDRTDVKGYYIYNKLMDTTTEKTTALFTKVNAEDTLTANSTNNIKISGVAVQTPNAEMGATIVNNSKALTKVMTEAAGVMSVVGE